MDTTEPCCTFPPAVSNYVAEGHVTVLDGLKVYITGDLSSDIVLICLYDSFGFHPNTKSFCDRLGHATKFTVVLPDVLRRNDAHKENQRPIKTNTSDGSEGRRSWESSVSADLDFLLNYFRIAGVQLFGAFGFCWGGRMALHASQSDELTKYLRASILIHPSMVTVEDAESVKIPTMLITTRDDPSPEPFFEVLKGRVEAGKCDVLCFEKMSHGFATTQANFEDELVRESVAEMVSASADFFTRILLNERPQGEVVPRIRFPCCFPCTQ